MMYELSGENMALTTKAVTPYTLSMDQESTDEDLMLSYQRGNAGAFEVLYSRHKGPVYRYVLRQCRVEETASELFQEIWMKLIQNHKHYEVKAKFTTWLYTIARHRIIDYYRQQGNRALEVDSGEVDSLSTAHTDQPDVRAGLQQTISQLAVALESLPALHREAFLLKEEAGMGLDEIAKLTGVNREAVKSRLRYAVKKLRQVMNP
jgi:RNA polymerase sigma-70 factor (ECF subfamily)